MKKRLTLPRLRLNPSLVSACLLLAFGIAWLAPEAQARVYATNVRLNGASTNLSMLPGGTVNVSYLLNEAASTGVTVQIVSGTNVVRVLAVPGGAPGSLKGTNAVFWDGRDGNSNYVTAGTYSVSVTAAAAGYPVWTQITSDAYSNNYVWQGRGIAVVTNPKSPYFGRIFVSNAQVGPDASKPGNSVGLLKLNADASAPADGPFSDGGYAWAGNFYSPWKVEVSEDDYVYVSDWSSKGAVFRWDLTLAAASRADVLRQDNWPTNLNGSYADLSGPAIFGTGTNTQIWMADATPGGLGLIRFNVDTNGVCATNYTGISVVGTGGSITYNPVDAALDKQGNIYTIQSRDAAGDPAPRVFQFPPYDPSTNDGVAEVTATWAIGSGNNTLGQASGVAVDPTGTYVAVSSQGIILGSFVWTNGCTQIFYASNGVLVTNLNLGMVVLGDPTHSDTDCAWDAAGNVYYIDNELGYWRTVSPPGANQFTTVANQLVVIAPLPPPVIVSQVVTSTNIILRFAADATDIPANFALLGAAQVGGPYSIIYDAKISQVGPGLFQATTSLGAQSFFNVQRVADLPPQPLRITSLTVSSPGANVILTFTASPGDAAGAFTVVSSSTVGGSYTPAAGATIDPVSPGVFRASVPATDPAQFYRIKR